MIRSGIALLDERLGGLVEGRTYVLSGAPGTGKSVACMEFIAAAIEEGEHAAILTHDDPTDLLAQAEYLGLDFSKALHDERLILLRYQLDFARRFNRAASPDVAFEELKKLMGTTTPSRVVIDSIAPFLEGSAASGAGLDALARFLDSISATAMITYPGDLAGMYDRRLEPMLQRAAAIMHFSTDAKDHTNRIDIRKVRYQVPSTAPIAFRIQGGAGIVPLANQTRRRSEDVPEDTKRRILVLNLAGSFPEDMLPLLRNRYDVAVRTGVTSALADLASLQAGAVLLDVRRDSLEEALTLVRELRRAGSRSPVVLVTSFSLRSNDRARALRAGADEFIMSESHPDEFLHRIESAMRRGHSAADEAEPEALVVTQPGEADRPEPLDNGGFLNAIRTHITLDRLPFFTLVTLTPSRPAKLRELCDLSLKSMRVDGGDLAGIADDSVMLYLHSARRKDVSPFVERLKEEWRRAGNGDLEVDVAAFPTDEERIRSLVEMTASA